MKYLRHSVFALLFVFAVFLKIERLRVEDVHVIDLQPFVYALGIGAVLLTILIPVLRRAPITLSLVACIGLYFLLKLVILPEDTHPLVGEEHTYVTVTEIAFIGLLVLLARNVARDLHDFEEAVENISLGEVGRRVQKLDRATDDIETELIRSRRHHRPLAVIVVQPEAGSIKAAVHRTVQEVQRAMMSRYVFTSLGRALGTTIRRSDILLADANHDRFVVFCPETDLKGSEELVRRMRETTTEGLGVNLSCGIATFPEQALTFEELVRQAEMRIPDTSTPLALLAPAAANVPIQSDSNVSLEKRKEHALNGDLHPDTRA